MPASTARCSTARASLRSMYSKVSQEPRHKALTSIPDAPRGRNSMAGNRRFSARAAAAPVLAPALLVVARAPAAPFLGLLRPVAFVPAGPVLLGRGRAGGQGQAAGQSGDGDPGPGRPWPLGRGRGGVAGVSDGGGETSHRLDLARPLGRFRRSGGGLEHSRRSGIAGWGVGGWDRPPQNAFRGV